MGARIKDTSIGALLKNPVETAKWVHTGVRQKALIKTKLRVPHQEKPMTVKELEEKFLKFAQQFDGEAHETTIAYFWKRDKLSGIYEFIGPDEEDEVAEEMGVSILTVAEEPEEEFGKLRGQALSAEAQAEFHAEMKEMREAVNSFLDRHPRRT